MKHAPGGMASRDSLGIVLARHLAAENSIKAKHITLELH
jgi:hypothetical protein